jgi:recombination endonuclease VII
VAIVDGQIRCSVCGDSKPLGAYLPSVIARGQGPCRGCHGARGAAWRAANIEKHRAQAAARSRRYRRTMTEEAKDRRRAGTREWVKANPDKVFEQKCLRRFGMSLADYEGMRAAQGGGCACCGAKVNKSGRRLGVDHDHQTGEVRGILCHHCNAGLGAFGDDPARLRLAIEYLKKHERKHRAPGVRINLMEVNHVGTA